MKHLNNVQSKNDWLYEFKPEMITLIGLIGIGHGASLLRIDTVILLGHICGLILLFFAYKIRKWRKVYRRSQF